MDNSAKNKKNTWDKKILEYPLDEKILIRKKKSLKKEILNREGIFQDIKIAILGGSTTSEVKEQLELFLLGKGFKPHFYESEYNKYFEDIMFGDELRIFNPDIIYIHTTIKNLKYLPKLHATKEEVKENLDAEFEHFKMLWDKIKKDFKAIIIQNNFELPKHKSLGNMDGSVAFGVTRYIHLMNMKFVEYAEENRGLIINDIGYLSARIGLDKWHDLKLWYSYKYAMSYEGIIHLAHQLSHIICALYGKTKKALVLDLDNTLWGGIIGDDGVENIRLGTEMAIGEAYQALQQYIKELKNRGITLAICSKNEEDIAYAGLKHPQMHLKLSDFTNIKANWEPKYLNIDQIAKEINIGLDSLVFMDDNPVERESVGAQLPQVEVPDIQDDIIGYIDYIDRNGYFEVIKISDEDKERANYYEANKNREEASSKFTTYEDFLESLAMEAEIESFKPIYLERIAQLTNKTNQFNLTTKRYTLQEIENVYKDDNQIKLYCRLKDKFGDNGLISAIIGKVEENTLHIDLWIMSCRVLKREVEKVMFDQLIEICKAKSIERIYGYYYKTNKNKMVSNHYGQLGFICVEQDEEKSLWQLEIDQVKDKKNNYIKVGAY